MKQLYIFLLILLLLASFASAKELNYYDSLKIKQTIEGDALIFPTQNQASINYFTVELLNFPKNYVDQEIESEFFDKVLMISDLEHDTRLFKWGTPDFNRNLTFRHSTILTKTSQKTKIEEELSFPLGSLPLSIQHYLLFTNTTDTNNQIKNKAQELAQGKTSLYELEFELAKFVIDYLTYDLSIYTQDTNMPSTWVYENKVGACDEYTNLFISLNRELGIPARFVSGIAYSNSEKFDVDWGNHAWAEVYFPYFGWVPFDLTYQQLGYIDSSHIILTKDYDGDNPTVLYSGRGNNYDFKTSPLKFFTDVIEMGDEKKDITSVNIYPKKDKVAFGSYNLIVAEITNPTDYYIIEKVTLAKTESIEYFDDLYKFIYLEPHKIAKIYWLIKVKDNLEKGNYYNFPVSYFNDNSNEFNTQFEVHEFEEYYSKEYMEQFISEDEHIGARKFNVYCHFPKLSYNNNYTIDCNISKKLGYEDIRKINICFEESCNEIGFAQFNVLAPYSFNITTNGLGHQTKYLDIEDEQYFLTYYVYDSPILDIDDIMYPKEIEFSQTKKISFLVNKSSFSNIQNVSLLLKHDNFDRIWEFEQLNDSNIFEIEIEGNVLDKGLNEFILNLNYLDENSTLVVKKYEFETNLINVNFQESILLAFNNFSVFFVKMADWVGINLYKKRLSNDQKKNVSFFLIIFFFILLFGLVKLIISLISYFYRRQVDHKHIDDILKKKK